MIVSIGTNSVEKYDSSDDMWLTVNDMPTMRNGFGAAVQNNKVFAVGGWSENVYKEVHIVEKYTPLTDVWVSCNSMPTKRLSLGVVTWGSEDLYAVAGIDQGVALRVSEKYDTADDIWVTINGAHAHCDTPAMACVHAETCAHIHMRPGTCTCMCVCARV